MLAVETGGSVLVVDCGGDVVQRLMASAVDLTRVQALIVTHEHADHVSGFPLMMERLWLAGRRDPLPVYGIAPAISQARRIHDAFDTSSWPDYPAIHYHEVAHETGAPVLEDDDWRVVASPGDHAVPVIALHFFDKHGGGELTYSCDTQYSTEVVRLAEGGDLLVHEATGSGPGHSSADEAARVASEAGAKRLVLVHLPPEAQLDEDDLEQARRIFAATEKGVEGGKYGF